jgi:hypothetical protein
VSRTKQGYGLEEARKPLGEEQDPAESRVQAPHGKDPRFGMTE